MGWGRVLLVALGLAFLLPSALLMLLWHRFYWVHRNCIEDAWRAGANGCFVAAEGVNYSGNAAFAIWPALVLLALAIVCFWYAAQRRGKAT